MKKIFISLFSLVLIITGGIFSIQSFSNVANANDTTTVVSVDNGEKLVQTLSNEQMYLSENIVIKLSKPIDMTDIDTTPISQLNKTFLGIFDGNGYTISNLTLTTTNQYCGLFPKTNGAIIQNVKISGNINFNFSPSNIQEVYAGVLVGYAENTIFSNCEFDNYEGEIEEIILPISTDFNFGMLAGKVKGNPIANSSSNRANIKDCVNYYDIEFNLNKQSNVYLGGLVGSVQNAFLLNTLNQGDVLFANNLLNGGDVENSNKQYLGGMVGTISGSGTQIRNSCFTGKVDILSVVDSLKFYKGAILGGALDNSTSVENINFNYYTDSSVAVCGDTYISSGDKIKTVDNINDIFLKNTENFDPQSQNSSFNFNTVWILHESRIHLQNFMIFNFAFNTINPYIDSAKFYISEGVGADTLSARYGTTVRIDLRLKNDYVGYFRLNKLNLTDNLLFDSSFVRIEPSENSIGQETSYTIYLIANATTKGTYAFEIQSITYNCIATISEDAQTFNQGGVRIADNNITTPTTEMNIPFTYNSAIKKITAEATSGSVYAFDRWKLYYKNDQGEFATTEINFANSTDSTLSIEFGKAPFDREFKLVAHFTDENAILVNFGQINTKRIKSIKFSGVDYDGTPIAVSPNHAKNLEIVTVKNYKLNVTAFEDAIKVLYGENSTETLVTADPEVNDAGETTYKFSLNMKYIEKLSKNELTLFLQVEEDDSNNTNDLLWLWITIPAVGVLLIGLIIFLILRRRRGGGKGGSTKVAKVKERKVSYKDYY